MAPEDAVIWAEEVAEGAEAPAEGADKDAAPASNKT